MPRIIPISALAMLAALHTLSASADQARRRPRQVTQQPGGGIDQRAVSIQLRSQHWPR